MNANIYEYGTDPKTGLKRRLIRDGVTVQEETDLNPKPKAVVYLKLQTYVENEGEIVVVTNETTGYEVVKDEISYDVNGVALPKHIINAETGEITTPINPETDEPYPRDNGYNNIILLSTMKVEFDTVLDNGIKEYYNLV